MERDSKVNFIKKLLRGEETLCPECEKAILVHFHKKAKKSNTDYICPSCKKRFQVIKLMDELNG